MPCRYMETPEEVAQRLEQAKSKAEADRAKVRLQQELDLATRLLCDVCSTLERASLGHKLASDILRGSELTGWWKRHKAQDEARKAREAEKARKKAAKAKAKREKAQHKAKALAKLTAAEKKALGL